MSKHKATPRDIMDITERYIDSNDPYGENEDLAFWDEAEDGEEEKEKTSKF